MARKKQQKTCDVCGGSGQVSFFKGVSRFLLSTEECLECAGTGQLLEPASGKAEDDAAANGKKISDRKR